MLSITIWYDDRAGYEVILPVTITSSPASGWTPRPRTDPFQITPSMADLSSFRVR